MVFLTGHVLTSAIISFLAPHIYVDKQIAFLGYMKDVQFPENS